jgi:hypothetical protein
MIQLDRPGWIASTGGRSGIDAVHIGPAVRRVGVEPQGRGLWEMAESAYHRLDRHASLKPFSSSRFSEHGVKRARCSGMVAMFLVTPLIGAYVISGKTKW